MADEFQQPGDGTLRVQSAEGGFQRIKTPTGFTDTVFRNIVAAFDTLYRLNGKTPSVTEIQALWSKVPVKTISALLVTDEFKQALEYRGIAVDENMGLSLEQSMALLALTNFSDSRSTAAKMRELGIPMARYQAWMKHPLFKEHYRIRTESQFAGADSLALNQLMSNMEKGDQRAIEKVLEITGRWNPQQQQIIEVRQILLLVVEAIVKNVHDPEMRTAILADIRQATESAPGLQIER